MSSSIFEHNSLQDILQTPVCTSFFFLNSLFFFLTRQQAPVEMKIGLVMSGDV